VNRAPRAVQTWKHAFRVAKRFDTLCVSLFGSKVPRADLNDRLAATQPPATGAPPPHKEPTGPGEGPPGRDDPAPYFVHRRPSSQDFHHPKRFLRQISTSGAADRPPAGPKSSTLVVPPKKSGNDSKKENPFGLEFFYLAHWSFAG
jgi:hypothetical protein